MRNILLVMWWELKLAFKNKVFLLSLFIIPTMFTLFLSPALQSGSSKIQGTLVCGVVDGTGHLYDLRFKNDMPLQLRQAPVIFIGLTNRSADFSENVAQAKKLLRNSRQIDVLLIRDNTGHTSLFLHERFAGGSEKILSLVSFYAGQYLHPESVSVIDEIQKAEMRILQGDTEISEKDFYTAYVRGMMFLLMLFFGISLAGNWFLRGFSEEKSNRLIEVLLCSMSMRHLMWGKFLGLLTISFSQNIILLILLQLLPGASGFVISSDIFLHEGLAFFFIGIFQFLLLYLFISLKSKTDISAQSAGMGIGLLALIPLPLYLNGAFLVNNVNITIIQYLPFIGPAFLIGKAFSPGEGVVYPVIFIALHIVYTVAFFMLFTRRTITFKAGKPDE